eukprot:TRINITY_DN11907_c0_g4_i1.p1 TRINITY_DN11907_c0_g4~~TRINITY_DN11907_c0_g4_i1.p1  ORF type:complete len:276 (+),score=25.23 TRINITY_DN11907_c0_g4_i1:2-829(+)
MAPEVVQGLPYSFPADMWSLGVILFALLSGRLPFCGATTEETFECVKRGIVHLRSPSWQGISPAAKAIVRRLLTQNPDERLTMEELMADPWLHQSCINCCANNVSFPEVLQRESARLGSGLHDSWSDMQLEGSGNRRGSVSSMATCSSSTSVNMQFVNILDDAGPDRKAGIDNPSACQSANEARGQGRGPFALTIAPPSRSNSQHKDEGVIPQAGLNSLFEHVPLSPFTACSKLFEQTAVSPSPPWYQRKRSRDVSPTSTLHFDVSAASTPTGSH